MAGDTYLEINSTGIGFQEKLSAQTSSGASAGQLVALNGSAQVDASLLPAIASTYTPATQTSNFNALINHLEQVDLNTAGANVTATLPDATLYSGQSLLVQVITASASHHVAFASTSSQTVNGAAVASLPVLVNVDQTYFFISDGSNWWTVSPVVDLAHNVTGTLAVDNGGTGLATLTAHNVIIGNGTSSVTLVAPGTAGLALVSTGATGDPAFGAVNLGATGAVTGVLPVLNSEGAVTATAGGTNITAGALIYLDSSGLIQLADNGAASTAATGFSPLAITASTSGVVVIGNGPNVGVTGLTRGTQYLLGTSGSTTTAVPTGTGKIVQPVGFAETTTELQVILGPYTVRA